MNQTEFDTTEDSAELEQSLINFIETLAKEDEVLVKILKSEKEIVEHAKKTAGNLEEMIIINDSVNRVIRNITSLQLLMQLKLEDIKEMLKNIEEINEETEDEEEE